MRNHLSNQSNMVHRLADCVRNDFFYFNEKAFLDEDTSEDTEELSVRDSSLSDYLDNLEVLLAEKRVDEALAALDQGNTKIKEASINLNPTLLFLFQQAISEQRHKLIDQLAATTSEPSTRGVELRSAASALKVLGDGTRAHTLLLSAHRKRLQKSIQSLRYSSVTGGAFAATLSQIVFSAIAHGAKDSLAVFGEEPAYSSELVTWAVKETESFALFLKRLVLASASAGGSLRVVADCVQISLGHSSLLEASGLALSPVLLRHFKPYVEEALNAYIKRIEQSCAAVAASEDWSLSCSPDPGHALPATGSTASQPKLSISAQRFHVMIQVMERTISSI